MNHPDTKEETVQQISLGDYSKTLKNMKPLVSGQMGKLRAVAQGPVVGESVHSSKGTRNRVPGANPPTHLEEGPMRSYHWKRAMKYDPRTGMNGLLALPPRDPEVDAEIESAVANLNAGGRAPGIYIPRDQVADEERWIVLERARLERAGALAALKSKGRDFRTQLAHLSKTASPSMTEKADLVKTRMDAVERATGHLVTELAEIQQMIDALPRRKVTTLTYPHYEGSKAPEICRKELSYKDPNKCKTDQHPVSSHTRVGRAAKITMFTGIVLCVMFSVQTFAGILENVLFPFQPKVASYEDAPTFLFLNHTQITTDEDGYFQCWANGCVYLIAEVGGLDDTWGGDSAEFSFEEIGSDLPGQSWYTCTTGLHSWTYVLPDALTLCNLTIPDWCRGRFTSLSVQPLYIAQGEVNATRANPAQVCFNASADIAILVWTMGNFSDLALSLNGATLKANNYENPKHMSIAVAQDVFGSEWLYFPARVPAGQQTLDLWGEENMTLYYQVMHGTADFDEDLLLDYEEMMSGNPALCPEVANPWGYQYITGAMNSSSIEDVIMGGNAGYWAPEMISFYIPDTHVVESYDPLSVDDGSTMELELTCWNGQYMNFLVDGDPAPLANATLVGYTGSENTPRTIVDSNGNELGTFLDYQLFFPSSISCEIVGPGWHSLSYEVYQGTSVTPDLTLAIDGQSIYLSPVSPDVANVDTDGDSVPDDADRSPADYLTWRKDTLLQLTVPCDRTSAEDVKIDIDVVRGPGDPDPSVQFTWHAGEVGARQVSLIQAMILYGPGSSAPAQGMADYWNTTDQLQHFMNATNPWPVYTYDLRGKDANGKLNDTAVTGDCDPLPQDCTMAYDYQMLVMPEQATNVSTYRLWYPSDHPAIQNDGFIVLRVRFVMAVIAEDSNLLGFYDFPSDINISAIAVDFLSDVNGLLGQPRDASENLILWACNMNPQVALDASAGDVRDQAIVANFSGEHFMTQYHYNDTIPATWGATERLIYARNATPWDGSSAEVTYLTSTTRTLDLLSKINQSIKFDLVTGEQYCVYPQQFDFASLGDGLLIYQDNQPVISQWTGSGYGLLDILRNVQTRANVTSLYASGASPLSLRLDGGCANETGTIVFSLYIPSLDDKCEIRFGNASSMDAFVLVVEKEQYGNKMWLQYRTPEGTLEKICEVWPEEWFSFEVWWDDGVKSFLTPNCSTWDVFMSGAMDYAALDLPSWHPCWRGIQYVDFQVFAGDTVNFDGFGFYAGQFGPDVEYVSKSPETVHFGDGRGRASFYTVSDVYNGTFAYGDPQLEGNELTLWSTSYSSLQHYTERATVDAWPVSVQFRRVDDSLFDGFEMDQFLNISFVSSSDIAAVDLPRGPDRNYAWQGCDMPTPAILQHCLVNEWVIEDPEGVPATVCFYTGDEIHWELDWWVGGVDPWAEYCTQHCESLEAIIRNRELFKALLPFEKLKKVAENHIAGCEDGTYGDFYFENLIPAPGVRREEFAYLEIHGQEGDGVPMLNFILDPVSRQDIIDNYKAYIAAYERILELIAMDGNTWDEVPRAIRRVFAKDDPCANIRLSDEFIASLTTDEEALKALGFEILGPGECPTATTEKPGGKIVQNYWKMVYTKVQWGDVLDAFRAFVLAIESEGFFRAIATGPASWKTYVGKEAVGGDSPLLAAIGKPGTPTMVWIDWVTLEETWGVLPAADDPAWQTTDDGRIKYMSYYAWCKSKNWAPTGGRVIPQKGDIIGGQWVDFELHKNNDNPIMFDILIDLEIDPNLILAAHPVTNKDPNANNAAMVYFNRYMRNWAASEAKTGLGGLARLFRNLRIFRNSRTPAEYAKAGGELRDAMKYIGREPSNSRNNKPLLDVKAKTAPATAFKVLSKHPFPNQDLAPLFASYSKDPIVFDMILSLGSVNTLTDMIGDEGRNNLMRNARHHGVKISAQGMATLFKEGYMVIEDFILALASLRSWSDLQHTSTKITSFAYRAQNQLYGTIFKDIKDAIQPWYASVANLLQLGEVTSARSLLNEIIVKMGYPVPTPLMSPEERRQYNQQIQTKYKIVKTDAVPGEEAKSPLKFDDYMDFLAKIDKGRAVISVLEDLSNPVAWEGIYTANGVSYAQLERNAGNPRAFAWMTREEWFQTVDWFFNYAKVNARIPRWLQEILEEQRQIAVAGGWSGGGPIPSSLAAGGWAPTALGLRDYMGRFGASLSFDNFIDLFGDGGSGAIGTGGSSLVTTAYEMAKQGMDDVTKVQPNAITVVPVAGGGYGIHIDGAGMSHDLPFSNWAPLGGDVFPYNYLGPSPPFNMPLGDLIIDATKLSPFGLTVVDVKKMFNNFGWDPRYGQAADAITGETSKAGMWDTLPDILIDESGMASSPRLEAFTRTIQQQAELEAARVEENFVHWEQVGRWTKVSAFLSAIGLAISVCSLVSDIQNGADPAVIALDCYFVASSAVALTYTIGCLAIGGGLITSATLTYTIASLAPVATAMAYIGIILTVIMTIWWGVNTYYNNLAVELTNVSMNLTAQLGNRNLVRHGGLLVGDDLVCTMTVNNTGHMEFDREGIFHIENDITNGAPFWFGSRMTAGQYEAGAYTWSSNSWSGEDWNGPWNGTEFEWATYPYYTETPPDGCVLDPTRGALLFPTMIQIDTWNPPYSWTVPGTPSGPSTYEMAVPLTQPATQLAFGMTGRLATTYDHDSDGVCRQNHDPQTIVATTLFGDNNSDGYIDLLYEAPQTVLEADVAGFLSNCTPVNTTTPVDEILQNITAACASYQWLYAANNASILAALAANATTMAQYNQTVGRLQSLVNSPMAWQQNLSWYEYYQNFTLPELVRDNYYLLQTTNAAEYASLLGNQTLIAAGWRAARPEWVEFDTTFYETGWYYYAWYDWPSEGTKFPDVPYGDGQGHMVLQDPGPGLNLSVYHSIDPYENDPLGPLFHGRITLKYSYDNSGESSPVQPFCFGLAIPGSGEGEWIDVAMLTNNGGYYYYNGSRVNPSQTPVAYNTEETVIIDFDYARKTVTFTLQGQDFTYSLQNHLIPTQVRVCIFGSEWEHTRLTLRKVQITHKTGRYTWTELDAQLNGYALTLPAGQILVPKAWVAQMNKTLEAQLYYANPAELFPCLTNIRAEPSWAEIPAVMPGDVLSGALQFTYEGTDNPAVAYTLTPPAGWGISTTGGIGSLLSITEVPFDLTVPVDAPAGMYYLYFNESIASGAKAGNTTYACVVPVRIYQNATWTLDVGEFPGVMNVSSAYAWATLFNGGTQPQQLLITGDGVPYDWLTADGFAPVMVWDFAAPTVDWEFTGGTSAITGGALVLQSAASERVSVNVSLDADLHPGDRVHVIYENLGAVDPVLGAWAPFALTGSGLQDRTFAIDAFETLDYLTVSANVTATTRFRVTHLSVDRALTRYTPLSQFVFSGVTTDIGDWGWDISLGSGYSDIWQQAVLTSATYVSLWNYDWVMEGRTETEFEGLHAIENIANGEECVTYLEVPLFENFTGLMGYEDFGNPWRYLATWANYPQNGADGCFEAFGCESFDESTITYRTTPDGSFWPISGLDHRIFREEWVPDLGLAGTYSLTWDLSGSNDRYISLNTTTEQTYLHFYDDESTAYSGKARPYVAAGVSKVGINGGSLVLQSDTTETFEISHDLANDGQPVALAAGDEVWVNFASILSSQVTLTLTNANPAWDDLVFVLDTGNGEAQEFHLENFVVPAAGEYTSLKISGILAPEENFSLYFAGVYKHQPNGVPFADMDVGGFFTDTIKPTDFTCELPSVLTYGAGHWDVLALQDNATVSNNASYLFAAQAEGRLDFAVYAPGTNHTLLLELVGAGGDGILLNISNYQLWCSNNSEVVSPIYVYGGWHYFSVAWDCAQHNYTVWHNNQTVVAANYTAGTGILHLAAGAITGIQLNTTATPAPFLIDGVYLDQTCHAPTNESLVELRYAGTGMNLMMLPGEEWTLYLTPGAPGTYAETRLAIYDGGQLVGLLYQDVAVNSPPAVTHCEEYSYISGLEDDKQVAWNITDGGYIAAGATWAVLCNGTPVAGDSWISSNTSVTIPTSNQVPGTYLYELWVNDGHTGNQLLDSTKVYVLDAPPEATPCANYSYATFEEYNRYAYWNLTHVGELGPSSYWEIRLGAQVVKSGAWVDPDGEIVYSWTGNQMPGSYVYALYADDGYSGLQHVSADINVTAYNGALPSSSSPGDCSFWTGRESATITWVLTDAGIKTGAGKYEVYRNDTVPFKVADGVFTHDEQYVSYTVEDLPPRAYNFSLYVTDGMSGWVWTDNVTVWANNTLPTANQVADIEVTPIIEPDVPIVWTITDLGAIHPSKAKIQVRDNNSVVSTVDFNSSPQALTPISTLLPVGLHNFTVWVDDGYTGYLKLDEVFVTVKNPLPWSDSPADFAQVDNEPCKNITWTITDVWGVGIGTWLILRNGTPVESGTWDVSGYEVSYNTTGQPIGVNMYTLMVNDSYSTLQDVDSVYVTYTDDDPTGPQVTLSYSGEATDGSPGYWIVSSASDPSGIYNFTVWYDGHVESGPGNYALGSSLGIHDCLVVAWDNDVDRGAGDRAQTILYDIRYLVDDDTAVPVIYTPQLSYGLFFWWTTVLVRITDGSGLYTSGYPRVKFESSWYAMSLSSGTQYDGYWTYTIWGYFASCHVDAYDNDCDRSGDQSYAYW